MAKGNGSGVHPIWWILGGTVAAGVVVWGGTLLWISSEAGKMRSTMPSLPKMTPSYGAGLGQPQPRSMITIEPK